MTILSIQNKLKSRGDSKQTKQTPKEKKSQLQTFSKHMILSIFELSLDLGANWKLETDYVDIVLDSSLEG